MLIEGRKEGKKRNQLKLGAQDIFCGDIYYRTSLSGILQAKSRATVWFGNNQAL